MNNSKAPFLLRWILWTVLIVASLIVCDFALYKILFRQYDKLNHISSIKKRSDILIVGASNIMWGVDAAAIQKATGLSTRMIATAGGDIEFRRHVVQEYLERHKDNPPRLLLVHTDRHLFSRKRYSPLAYLPLQGYYHQGILRDYLRSKWTRPRDRYLKPVLRSLTLNSEAYFVGGKLYDRVAGPLRRLWRNIGGRQAETLPPERSAPPQQRPGQSQVPDQNKITPGKSALPSGDRLKIAEWRKRYANLATTDAVDPAMRAEFERLSTFLGQRTVAVIFLETPVFRLFQREPNREARKLINSQCRGKIQCLRLEHGRMERDISLYFDASHLNRKGRAVYTDLLIQAIRARLRSQQRGK